MLNYYFHTRFISFGWEDLECVLWFFRFLYIFIAPFAFSSKKGKLTTLDYPVTRFGDLEYTYVYFILETQKILTSANIPYLFFAVLKVFLSRLKILHPVHVLKKTVSDQAN